MAVICFTLFLVRDYRSLEAAREDYSRAEQVWEAGITTVEEVVVQSELLAQAEADSQWISSQKAISNHKVRMNHMLKKAEMRSVHTGVSGHMQRIRDSRDNFKVE